MTWKGMCASILAVGAMATITEAGDKHEKVELSLGTAGIVKLRPECSSLGSALEVEVELKDGLADASCVATVVAGTTTAELEGFSTDDEGEGEVKADIDLGGQMGSVAVTVTVDCTFTDPVTGEVETETISVSTTLEIACDTEDEEI